MTQPPDSRRLPRAPIDQPRCAIYMRTAIEPACEAALAALDARRDACVALLRGELGATWTASFEDLGFPA